MMKSNLIVSILSHLQECGYTSFEYWKGITQPALPGYLAHNRYLYS